MKQETKRAGAPAPAQKPHPRPAAGSPSGAASARLAPFAVIGLAVCAVLALCYWNFWRPVSITVNGEGQTMLVNTSVLALLEDRAFFDAPPGRLLSLGGAVLDEAGGERCTVRLNGEELASSRFADTKVPEGAELEVSAGADRTEPSFEQTVAAAPGITMESGGAVQFVSQWGVPGKKVVTVGERSGETVDKEIVQAPVDMVVSSLNVKPQGAGKYIALTFDDGPSGYTPDILGILASKGAKATFFNLGSSEARYASYAKQLVDGGHELASHTNAHQYLPDLDAPSLRAEITSAADAIESAAGVRPQMMRAPYGAFTANDWARAGDLISCNVLWNIDTLDWKRPGAAAITSMVLDNAFNGAIVLMHDGGGNRAQDVEALPGIIDGLRGAGYELVTVSELMDKDDRFPDAVVEGDVAMPEGAELPPAA